MGYFSLSIDPHYTTDIHTLIYNIRGLLLCFSLQFFLLTKIYINLYQFVF